MSLRGKLASALELPYELFGGVETVVHAREEVTVSHCKKILQYSPTEITLHLDGMHLSICGTGLTLARYLGGNITVRGTVETISFVQEKGGTST